MYRIGIDLGGTNIVAGLVDDNCKIIDKTHVKTALPQSPEGIVEKMSNLVFDLLKKTNTDISEVSFVGIGSPGAVNPETGVVIYANNLKFDNVPLGEMMKQKVGIDCYLQNDANAAAYGEYIAGSGKGTKNFVAVTLGTGVGGGIIVDGKIYSGSNFAGGELGHTVIDVNGIPCSCGRVGCYEAYASATALISQTKAMMLLNYDSLMWDACGGDIDNVNGITAFAAMKKGDLAAKSVVNRYIYYVSAGLANILNTFQPEIICIGGGIANEGDGLINPLKKLLSYGNCAKKMMPMTNIRVATLGDDAGIIGAAFLKD